MAAQPQDFAKLVRFGMLNIVVQFNTKFNLFMGIRRTAYLKIVAVKNEYKSFKTRYF